MRTAPNNWNTLWASKNRVCSYKIQFIGEKNSPVFTDTLIESESLKFSGAIFTTDKLIGNTPCMAVEFVLNQQDTVIDPGSEVEISIKLVDGTQSLESGYLSLGKYLVYTRTKYEDGWTKFFCRDKMNTANQPYIPAGTTIGEWPRSMSTVMSESLERVGLTLDPRVTIQEGDDWMVQLPTEYTIRQVWGFIAAAHGGNFYITPQQTLMLSIPQIAPSGISLDDNYTEANTVGGMYKVGQVILIVDDNNYVASGESLEHDLLADCPYATQGIADYAKSKLTGDLFQGIHVKDVLVNPLLEWDDTLSVDGNLFKVGEYSLVYDLEPIGSKLSSSSVNESSDEYGFEDTDTAKLNRKIRNAYAQIKLQGDSIESTVRVIQENKAESDGKYEDLSNKQQSTNKKLDNLENQTNSLEGALNSTNSELSGKLDSLEKEVSLKVTQDDVSISISEALSDGVTQVDTKTGYTFNADGMTIDKTDASTSTTVNENGMVVNRKTGSTKEAVLTANDQGVDAINLTAHQYLIIGSRSRFEDYGSDRTGCFWIG